jgi:shikimate kinase
MTVVLIGPPASGKSRVGRRLARRLKLPWIDTDRAIVAEHGSIPAIFAEHGEAHFRELERQAVVAALTQDAVVSLGGGAVLDLDTRSDLAALPVVLLTISDEAVEERLGKKAGSRPLSTDVDSWRALVDKRRPIYESLADLTVDTSTRPISKIADEIAEWARTARTSRTEAS